MLGFDSSVRWCCHLPRGLRARKRSAVTGDSVFSTSVFILDSPFRDQCSGLSCGFPAAVEWIEVFLCNPQPVKQDRQFSRNRDKRAFLCIPAITTGEFQSPSFQCGIGADGSKNMLSALNQDASHVPIAALGDTEFRITGAGLMALRPQSQIAADIPAMAESALVSER
jgi:hypothetical protein